MKTKLRFIVLWAEVEPHLETIVQKSMKPTKPPKSAARDKPDANVATAAVNEKATPHSVDLGIAERRHFIRPIPVPDAVESDGDTDWDTFQTLNSELPKD